MREATEVHAGIKCCCFSCHHSLPLPPPPLMQTRSQNAFTNLPPKVLKTDASIRVSSASASVDKQRGRAPPPSASLAIPRRRRARWCPRLALLFPACEPCDLAGETLDR